jgi:pyruvate dehydrogenase E1 component beta subunit
VGTAIGLALRGYRPVCEIQFDGFVYPAFDQIVAHLAKMRARTNGRIRLPVTVRIPFGGGIKAIEHHSESNEAYFAHTAGLRVVSCSSPGNAYDMLRAAIASDDPVIFYEPKRLYWDKEDVNLSRAASLGVLDAAAILRSGTDVTLVTYGPTVRLALAAADIAQAEGRSIEVIDLRSLSPIDMDTVNASVRKTGRAVVVHEAPTFLGMGSEVAAAISHDCFYSLEAPVQRVGGYNIPYPPSRVEDEYLPDVDRLLDAVDRTFEE